MYVNAVSFSSHPCKFIEELKLNPALDFDDEGRAALTSIQLRFPRDTLQVQGLGVMGWIAVELIARTFQHFAEVDPEDDPATPQIMIPKSFYCRFPGFEAE